MTFLRRLPSPSASPEPPPAGRPEPEDSSDGPHRRDPLAEALAFASRRLDLPHSAEALKAGLPLVEGRLSVEAAVEAAERAGMTVTRSSRRPSRLTALDLPAILVLTGDRVVVVTEIGRGWGRRAGVFDVATAGSASLAVRELDRMHAGVTLIVHPQPDAGPQTIAGFPDTPRLWLLRAFAPSGWTYLQVLLATPVINLLGLAMPLFTMNVYDRVVPNQALDTLWFLAVGVAIATVFDVALRQLRAYMTDVAARRADAMLGGRVLDRILHTGLGHRARSSGALANTVRELDILRDFFNAATLMALGDLPFLALYILAMWLIAGSLALVPAVMIPVVIGLGLLLQLPLGAATRRQSINGAHRNTVLFEVLGGLETIKALGAESWAASRWERAHAAGVRAGMAVKTWSSLNVNLTLLVQVLGNVAILVLGVLAIRDGDLTQGGLIAAVLLNGRAMAPLGQIAHTVGRLHQVLSAYRDIDRVMQAPVERRPGMIQIARDRTEGRVEFRKVRFAYPPPAGTGRLLPPVTVLDGVDIAIGAGERVGIVGTIGSGKSTLLKLALNLYPPTEGTVHLDGVEVGQLDPSDLRAGIGYMAQDPQLFSGTIRENMTLHAPLVDDEHFLRAARLAGVTDWIGACPLGFGQPVGEGGAGLSGGQKQSVALARALLRDPRVLLLDEPTSLLDSRTENAFVQRLAEIVQGRTLILVTHRPALLALVERLVVLDRGRVALDGPKEGVLAALAKAADRASAIGRKAD